MLLLNALLRVKNALRVSYVRPSVCPHVFSLRPLNESEPNLGESFLKSTSFDLIPNTTEDDM